MGSLALSFFAWCGGLHAQPAAQPTRVGVVGFFTESEAAAIERDLREHLRSASAHRVRRGLQFQATVLGSGRDSAAMTAAVTHLQGLQPDIVLVNSPLLVPDVLSRLRDVPVILSGEAVLENLPYIHSVARPGGRVTGFLRQTGQLSKRVELLQSFCPAVRTVGVINVPSAEGRIDFVEYIAHEDALLRVSGSRVVSLFIGSGRLELLPELVRKHRIDALDIVYNLDVRDHLPQVLSALASLGLPYVFNRVQPVEQGAALGTQPAAFDFARTGAEYIVRIANGEKPGEIPIQISRAYDIAVNSARIQGFRGCDPRRIARITTRFLP